MSAFPHARFLTSAHEPHQFVPDVGAEVAIAGRSNSGKSSAINAITQRHALARTSRTPGQTQLVNFFELEAGRRLVDLPGYGFAKVPRPIQRHWEQLLDDYFTRRASLRALFVVMDVRHPLTEHDWRMMEYARGHGRGLHLLLTKADKLGRGAGLAALAKVRRAVGELAGVQLFSAPEKTGVDEARRALRQWLDAPPADKNKPGGAGGVAGRD